MSKLTFFDRLKGITLPNKMTVTPTVGSTLPKPMIQNTIGSTPPKIMASSPSNSFANSNSEFTRMKLYIQGKYRFSGRNGIIDTIHIIPPKKSLSNLMIEPFISRDFNIHVLLCELFEQGYSPSVEIYLKAYVNGLDMYGTYGNYVKHTKI